MDKFILLSALAAVAVANECITVSGLWKEDVRFFRRGDELWTNEDGTMAIANFHDGYSGCSAKNHVVSSNCHPFIRWGYFGANLNEPKAKLNLWTDDDRHMGASTGIEQCAVSPRGLIKARSDFVAEYGQSAWMGWYVSLAENPFLVAFFCAKTDQDGMFNSIAYGTTTFIKATPAESDTDKYKDLMKRITVGSSIDRFAARYTIKIPSVRVADAGEFECTLEYKDSKKSDGVYVESAMTTITVHANGGFGQWGDWGKCSRTCGEGRMLRRRACDSPPPSGGGKECTGNPVIMKTCHLKDCTVCENKFSECEEWARKGLCEDEKEKEFIQNVCCKACKSADKQ